MPELASGVPATSVMFMGYDARTTFVEQKLPRRDHHDFEFYIEADQPNDVNQQPGPPGDRAADFLIENMSCRCIAAEH